MKAYKKCSVVLILFLLLGACSPQAKAGGTYVWIDSPVDQLTLEKVEAIKIEGHAASPDGINQVQILINGQMYTTINNPPWENGMADFETAWTPSGPGEYVIHAVAYGKNGQASELDVIHIRFGEQMLVQAVEITATIAPTLGTATVLPPDPTIDDTPTLVPTLTFTPVRDTPTLVPLIEFIANPTTVTAGKCATVAWHVENVQRVIYGGVDQPFSGSDQACPCKDSYYPLTVIHLDGREEKKTVQITVTGSCVTPVPPDTTPPPAPVPMVPKDGLSLSCRSSQALTWLPVEDISGIASYDVQVQRSTSGDKWIDAPGSPVVGVTDKTTTISVECGWIYHWSVRARDKKGNIGPWSAWSTFSIPLN